MLHMHMYLSVSSIEMYVPFLSAMHAFMLAQYFKFGAWLEKDKAVG